MKPAHKKIEKIDERLRNKPLRGDNLLYIAQMTRPSFYIYESKGS